MIEGQIDNGRVGGHYMDCGTCETAPTIEVIQPKVVVTDDVDEGFFSELGALFSNYFGAASFFFLFILLAALGTGYVLRASRIDEPKLLVSTSMDAELLED